MSTDAQSSNPRKRLRTNTGCMTCRSRHVKCDERRPSCKNCGKKNRICRWDDGPRQTKRAESRNASIASINPQSVDGPESPSSATASLTQGEFHVPVVNLNSGPSQLTIGGGIHSKARPDSQPSPAFERFADAARGRNWLTTFLRDDTYVDTPSPSGGFESKSDSPLSSFSTNLASVLLRADLDKFPGQGDISNPQQKLPIPPGVSSTLGHSDDALNDNSPIVFRVANPIKLMDSETAIFRNYVERLSRWIDTCSPDRPFYYIVPTMALNCPALLHSILALSSKQIALLSSKNDPRIKESVATHLYYYRRALKAVSRLLANPEYAHSDEVLASCIILSTYEMLDVAEENVGSHLEGITFLLRSRQVHGALRGIRGATYWTWYRQQIWVALHTGKRMTFHENLWEPESIDSFEHLSIEDISNRVVFLFGQCINFCNDDGKSEVGSPRDIRSRDITANALRGALEDWKGKLPSSMTCCFTEEPLMGDSYGHKPFNFPSIWFIYPQAAVAHQIYHACKILLSLHWPSINFAGEALGKRQSLTIRRQIEQSREQISLVASAGLPETWSFVSAQCLYIGGLVTDGAQERRRTLDLIEDCQKRSGRKTVYVADELRKLWAQQS